MTQRAKIDFTQYEPKYPKLFRLLRKAGWHQNRWVDFVDADLGTDGKARGILILQDYADAFLHSFYGIKVPVPEWYVEFCIGFGDHWKRMDFEKHGVDINGLSGFTFPYPILGWDRYCGFVTEEGRALAVDDCYQTYVRAVDPFQMMEWIVERKQTPGLEKGYLERKDIPYEYWNLIADRPLEYHLPRYRAYALTEAGQTDHVVERIEDGRMALRVHQLVEAEGDLFVRYRRHDPNMHAYLAHRLLLHKLLNEFFEGRYRGLRIHFENVDTGETETMG